MSVPARCRYNVVMCARSLLCGKLDAVQTHTAHAPAGAVAGATRRLK